MKPPSVCPHGPITRLPFEYQLTFTPRQERILIILSVVSERLFQLVALGPAVSAMPLLYNVIAMPAGIWRCRRAAHLSYPLVVGAIALGSLVGIIVGVVLRAIVVANLTVFEPLLDGPTLPGRFNFYGGSDGVAVT